MNRALTAGIAFKRNLHGEELVRREVSDTLQGRNLPGISGGCVGPYSMSQGVRCLGTGWNTRPAHHFFSGSLGGLLVDIHISGLCADSRAREA